MLITLQDTCKFSLDVSSLSRSGCAFIFLRNLQGCLQAVHILGNCVMWRCMGQILVLNPGFERTMCSLCIIGSLGTIFRMSVFPEGQPLNKHGVWFGLMQ